MNSRLGTGFTQNSMEMCRRCGNFMSRNTLFQMLCSSCGMKNKCTVKFIDLAKISPMPFSVTHGLCKKCKKGDAQNGKKLQQLQ
jgi:hypothetical protein